MKRMKALNVQNQKAFLFKHTDLPDFKVSLGLTF